MKLTDQISELEVEFHKVSQGQSNEVAIRDLNLVYQNLSPSLDELKINATHRVTCRELPGEFALVQLSDEEVGGAEKAVAAITAFLAEWDDLDNKYEIGQQDVCHNTRDAVENLNVLLQTTSDTAYTSWKKQVRDVINVSDSDLDKQDTSPDLKMNAEQYRSLYQRLQDVLDVPDPTLATIGKIETLKKEVLETLDKMEFNQPDDVIKLFKYLKQIGNSGRAPLSLLTEDVLKWMKEEGQEDFFYIGDKRVR